MIPSRAMGLRLAAIAAVLACASTALAAPPLVGVAVEGAPTVEFAAALATAAAKGAGDRTVPVPTCVTATCAHDLLTARGASEGVAVSVIITGEFHDQFAIRATLVDVDGHVLRRRVEECPTCTVVEVTDKINATVSELIAADDHDTVDVAVATPRPVALTVDGVAAGTTPFVGKLLAGPHVFEIAGERRELFVESTGEPLRIELGMAPGPRRPRGRIKPLTYAAAGAGVALIATGAYLVSIDGDPTCPHPSCPEERASAGLGWTTIGLGVASLGAAGYLYWRDRQAAPAVVVAPTSEGVAAMAVGRF